MNWNLMQKAFTTDKLQNIYYLSTKNEIVKLKPDGTEQFRYINKTLDEPTYLDATNPFNLLLFYPDYQNVVTLDRTMNLAGQYSLFQLNLFQVNAIGAAGDGNLWVYDEVTFRLKKIGLDGRVILQSSDLSLELGENIKPNLLLERGQQVYLNDPAYGILVFDVFGRHSKTLPIMGLTTFQVSGDQLLYWNQGQLKSFHLKALLEVGIRLPVGVPPESKVRVEKDRFYALVGRSLKVYSL